MEKILEYPRDQVTQDTYYNCGPASAQTIIRAATGELISEVTLGRKLKTHRGGTDWIGQFPAVLNELISGAEYVSVAMPNDPPTAEQRAALWKHLVSSIDAGHGVVANIVAPPNNYPRAVSPSTISPAYRGGWVYHYVALMGYSDQGQRRVWVADSGFYPFGYWISFTQLAGLIAPKGYAYSKTIKPAKKEKFMFGPEQVAALHEAKVAALASSSKLDELTGPRPSLINKTKAFTLNDYIRLLDAAVWESRQLMDAVARKVGLDPVEIVAEARKIDNGGAE